MAVFSLHPLKEVYDSKCTAIFNCRSNNGNLGLKQFYKILLGGEPKIAMPQGFFGEHSLRYFVKLL